MTAETRKRWKYSADLIQGAVAVAPAPEQGYNLTEAARSYGIVNNLIRCWKQKPKDEVSDARLGVNTPPRNAALAQRTSKSTIPDRCS